MFEIDEVERMERIDELADRMLLMAKYEDMPATEVWDLAAEKIDAMILARKLERV